MLITFLGTAAANAFPEAFCKCHNCEQARRLGGASLRKRSAAFLRHSAVFKEKMSWSPLGVLIWWPEHDMPHPPEYMAEQFRLLITLDLRQVLGLEPRQT